jgi:hypothetical protein
VGEIRTAAGARLREVLFWLIHLLDDSRRELDHLRVPLGSLLLHRLVECKRELRFVAFVWAGWRTVIVESPSEP